MSSSHSLLPLPPSPGNNCIGKTHAVAFLCTAEIDVLPRALKKCPLLHRQMILARATCHGSVPTTSPFLLSLALLSICSVFAELPFFTFQVVATAFILINSKKRILPRQSFSMFETNSLEFLAHKLQIIQRKSHPFWTYISKSAVCCSSTGSHKGVIAQVSAYAFSFYFSRNFIVLLIFFITFLCSDKWLFFLWKFIFKSFQPSLKSWVGIQTILLIDFCFFLLLNSC